MQLHKLKDYLGQYAQWLGSRDAEKRLHYWESQAIWQKNWDSDTTDFARMYDQSLQNSTTRRLWKREAYEPKRMLLEFIAMDHYFVHSMFTDLFNEDKDAHARADRFVFYCDQLLQEYRQKYPAKKDNSHYHDDGYGIISLYLCFRYPTLHAPYDADRQRTLLQQLGAANIPLAGDFQRHIKLIRTLQNFMNKEQDVLDAHQQRLRPEH